MATLIDVAKEANVSTATVSRVLNGSYAVTEEKRIRVMAAVEKIGYKIPERLRKPNYDNSATSFSGKRLILMIAGEPVDSILIPFQFSAQAYGFQTVLFRYISPEDRDSLSAVISSLSEQLAGILLLNCPDSSREFQDLVRPYPLVQIGTGIMENAPNMVIKNDAIRICQDAVDYLAAKGCRKIGILVPDNDMNTPLSHLKDRMKGYYLALLEHDIPIDESYVVHVDISKDGGYEGTQRLLQDHEGELDAIIGIIDQVAQGAVYALYNAGLTTSDIKVFSLDSNAVWSPDAEPIPYIDPRQEELGYTSFHILKAVINKEITQDYTVVVGHSIDIVE